MNKIKFRVLLIALAVVFVGVAMFSNPNLAVEGNNNVPENEIPNGVRNISAYKEEEQLVRPYTHSKYQYRVPNNILYTVVKLYNSGNPAEQQLFQKAIYCLRGGVGFGSDGDVSGSAVTYDVIGEMHNNPNAVIEKYKELYKVDPTDPNSDGINLDRTENITFGTDTKQVNIYTALLWVIDESYLPEDKLGENNTKLYDEAEYKTELLSKAGIPLSEQGDITKDDIEVIQQLAMWYFANYDEQKAGIIPTVSQAVRWPAQFISINGNNNIENVRAENLNRLYQYLIEGAIENSSAYVVTRGTGDVITNIQKVVEENRFDDSSELTIRNVVVPGAPLYNYYEIGPIQIEGTASERKTVNSSDIIFYDAEGKVIPRYFEITEEEENPYGTGEITFGGYNVVYRFMDGTGDEAQEATKLIKGMNYYIRFYKVFEKGNTQIEDITPDQQHDMSSVSLKIGSSYSQTTATFLATNSGAEQALVEIEKEKVYSEHELTAKKFDLALRKFITKITRKVGEQTIDVSFDKEGREPTIDTSTLINGIVDERTGRTQFTATYTHDKDPIEVKNGDIVTYTIRIYNEGEKEGKATLVVDYLPNGLELAEATPGSINDTYGWYADQNNSKKILTNYLSNQNAIPAFDKDHDDGHGSGLSYVDLQVECKVIATPGNANVSLRNVAEIVADTDDDVDSDTNSVNYETYNYQEQNSIIEQDDDDWENLVLKKVEFDLALRKFISKVERVDKTTNELKEVEIVSREPVLYTKELDENAEVDTAKYKHPKNTLSLKRGDIITYTIRVYNECKDVDGYATLITDYLPAGLELVEGRNNIWTANGNTLTTNSLAESVIPAYSTIGAECTKQDAVDNGPSLYYRDLTIVCKISETDDPNNPNYVEDFARLVNIAEISTDLVTPTDIDDRDSQPGNFPENKKNNEYDGNGVEDGYYPGQQDDDDFEPITVEPQEVFDLALRKNIVEVKNSEGTPKTIDSRTVGVHAEPLTQGGLTADYYHRKDAVEVEVGDFVTYRLSTYNEGDIKGYVYSIKDYLPDYLEFVPGDKFVSQAEVTEYNTIKDKQELTPTEEVLKQKVEAAEYMYVFDETNRILTISNLQNAINMPEGQINSLWSLEAFNGTNIDSRYVDVTFKVKENAVFANDTYLTNVATMTYGSKGTSTEEQIADRDSNRAGDDHLGEEFNVPSQSVLVSESETAYTGGRTETVLNKTDYHYIGQQDDDDFEKLVVRGKPFDLALRKFISKITRKGTTEVAFDSDSRKPKINLDTLINKNYNRDGKLEPTATYEHVKDPLTVKQGDKITYTLRIYNEGDRAGYATEITDYIPEGLALIVDYNTNFDNGWSISQAQDKVIDLVGENGFYKTEEEALNNFSLAEFDKAGVTDLKNVKLVKGGAKITSTILNDQLIQAFDKNKTSDENPTENGWQQAELGEYKVGDSRSGLYYKDVQVTFLVIADNSCKDVLTNYAEISEDKDQNKNDVDDIDSTPNNIDTKHEDDDDYEPVVLKYFDLALRKFITGVETNGKMEEVTSRIPVISYDAENGKLVYTHPKEEAKVLVGNNDIVVYTLRVFNEGTVAGYAEEITDDIPDGLEFLPNYPVNKDYEWKMYDKDGNVTDDVTEAVTIKTDYLSSEKEAKSKLVVVNEETGETSGGDNVRDNLIKPFDNGKAISGENPDYRDVKVAFKVIEPNTSDRTIINSAQISEDSDDDEDSTPGKWIETDDDQDKEYIYVKYFDLSLLKWVTKTIVTVDGKTTTTSTGFKPNTGKTETTGIRDNDAPEPIAKVEVDKKKLDKTTVKFAYTIRVTNEGEIEGYATEITDYIPEGLEFIEEDNKAFGWHQDGDDKVTTRALETVLLKPGETAEVEIIFTWKKSTSNLGLKTNIAEISEDDNIYDAEDIDSTPDNKTESYESEQEDDDDFALVLLSIKTGKGASYTILIISVLTVLASGVYLIKKYVLEY